MKYIDFDVVQLRQPGSRPSYILGKGIMYDIGRAMAIVYQESEIRGLSEESYAAGIGDGCSRELRLHHHVYHSPVVNLLLPDLGVGHGCRWRTLRRMVDNGSRREGIIRAAGGGSWLWRIIVNLIAAFAGDRGVGVS